MKLPMHLAKHRSTSNAVLSLLNAAWRQRAAGNRVVMRSLAISAVRLHARWNKPALRQGNLQL